MPEDFEEQHSEPLDMQRYLDIARRRYPHFLAAAFLGWLVVWGTSWVLPVSYKSGTLILVEEPNMPKDYVVSNINEDLQNRLRNITQQILSRTRLLRIIDKLNLDGGKNGKLTPDEKAARMQKNIDLEVVHDPGDDRVTAFTVSYSAPDPRVAQQVTWELTNLFINENQQVREQQSEDTTKFLENQLEIARQSLAQQDAKIQAFKGQHMGDLPSQQASNLQILAGLQSQLQSQQDALNTAQQQRVYLQTLINQYRSLQGPSKAGGGAAPDLPAVDQQLDKLRSQLAELSAQYTDQYPDVRNLKVEIAKTEKIRKQLVADMRNKSDRGSQAGDSSTARDGVELIQNPAMLQLQSQFQANHAEISNRSQAMAALEARIGQYQARLNDEPMREQQLTDLTRGYDQSKSNYDELLKKESESKMATSMEEMQKGERFRMLDPPSLPLKPYFPNRLKFCGMGLGLGLALGVVVAGGFEFIDDRLHTEKEIKSLLPMKVISEIPQVLSASDERRSKRRMLLGWALAILVFAVVLAGSAISYRYS